MAKPIKAKEAQPGAIEGGAAVPAGGGLDLKFIITLAVILVASIGSSAASVYFLAPIAVGDSVANKVVAAVAAQQEAQGKDHGHGGGEHGDSHAPKGMNLEMDEFTVNLKTDPTLGGNQFLRTKMTLTVQVPDEQYCDPTGGAAHAQANVKQPLVAAAPSVLSDGTIAGAAASLTPTVTASQQETLLASGGGGPDPFTLCQQTFNKNLARFIPTIRDIINQALMKRSAGTLGSIEGQEALKDEIKEQINQMIGPDYQILRVNFSDFIIQY